MSRQPDSKTQERPKRVPLSGRKVFGKENKDPNYVYRYVNANLEKDPERVARFKEAGYEIVPRGVAGDLGDNKVDSATPMGSVAELSVGQGTKAVLMRQRKEWYLEDQSAKQAEVDAIEQTMRRESKSDYGTLDVMNPKR
jgi:hypothetical protein